MFSESVRTALRLLEEKLAHTEAKIAAKQELQAALDPRSSTYRTVSRKIQVLRAGSRQQAEDVERMRVYLDKRVLCESPTPSTSPIVVCRSSRGLSGDTQRP